MAPKRQQVTTQPEDDKEEKTVESVAITCKTLNYNELQFGKEVGEGSFAKVHHGFWGQESVAIKVLQDDSDTSILDFTFEAQLLSQLNHPNIIKIHGSIDNPHYCLVMEYMPHCLFNVIQLRYKYDWPTISYKIITGMARGLAYLHQNDILHRDIKPANVLLDAEMNPKICDFGLAAKLKDGTYNDAGLYGTMRYLPREVYMQQRYSKKSDIYSFGLTIFEIATGESALADVPNTEVAISVIAGYKDYIPSNCDPKMAHLINWCRSAADYRPTADQIVEYLEKPDKLVNSCCVIQ